MNNLGKSLLVASFAIGAANATGSTNKTFFSGRPVGVNLAMEGTTWHNEINTPTDLENHFNGSLQVTGFYQENTNENNLAKYFSFQNKNNLVVAPDAAQTDVDHRHLVHDPLNVVVGINGGSIKFTGTMDLEYVHEAAGVRLDYFQDLDHFYEGLYFKVSAPIAWQNSGVKLNLSSDNVTTTVSKFGATAAAGATDSVSIADYFSGNLSQTNELPDTNFNVGQAPLKFAKIDGPKDSFGLADVDVVVGFAFKESDSSHAGFNVGLTIPTSPAPDGRFLGQEWYGNNGHWGVGAGGSSNMNLWQSENSRIDLDMAFNWRFLFKDREVRTLGLVDQDWGQYLLMGKNTDSFVAPAANELTHEVVVHPRNQIDSKIGLSVKSGNFFVDLGYNLFAKESERVTYNPNSISSNSDLGIAAADFNDDSFGVADVAGFDHKIGSAETISSNYAYIEPSRIDVEPARTPSQVTHKVYTGLGYVAREWSTPLMVGLGASYEGYSSQIGLEGWAVWGKLGLTF